jgi:HlyD family secretion protein
MKKVILISIPVLVILAVGFFLTARANSQNQAELLSGLEVVTIEQGTMPFVIAAQGRVYANQSAVLSWKIPGKVGQVDVSSGVQVSAGDTLAALETSSLPPTVILAQSELVKTQNALDDLYNSERQAAAALKAVDDAQNALEDALNPERSQAQAQADVANAAVALEDAQRQYDILTAPVPQSAINQAYANLVLAENKLAQTRETIQQIEQQILFGAAGIPDFLPDAFRTKVRTDLRKALRQALDGLQIQLTQDQLAYENSLARYNNLLAPPDPLDVTVAQANLAAARAQLDDAQKTWERSKDGPSPADITVLEAVLSDAQREWQRLKDGPDPDDITMLEAQVAASQAILNQTSITAPFDGLVTLVQSQAGDQVAPGTLAFRIDDVSHLFVDLQISEIDINQIEIGQDVNLAFESVLAKTYRGKVVDVAVVGTELSGAINFEVRAELLDADEDIRIGMTSNVEIITRQKENVVAVPNRSIRALDGETVVYVLDAPVPLADNQKRLLGLTNPFRTAAPGILPVRVELGETSGKLTEVIAGDLELGEQVVVDPPSELTHIPSRSSARIVFQHP